MLYSGVNIFGQLSELYLKSRDDFIKATSTPSTQTASEAPEGSSEGSIGLSSSVLQIFKKLQKRDPVTKVKAFQELDVYLNALEADSDELTSLLTFFLYHFCRILINESDKKVREAAHSTFAVFIKRDKRKLGPHIKKIFPLWVCSFFDPSPEAAKQAKDNFDAAFPKNRQSAVFLLAYKNFLHFANEQLRQSEDSVASESKQQADNTFDRITSSVLNALGYSFTFIVDWPADEQQHYKKKMLDILELAKPLAASLDDQEQQITTEGKNKTQPKPKAAQNYMWAFLTQKYRGMVRAASLQFVTTFLVRMPDEIVQQHIPHIAPLVFSLLSEDNSMLQATLWKEAIFTIGKNFADSCWNTVAIKKDVLPKLYKCLKEAAYGAQSSLYENFVKFVSICPIYNLAALPGQTPADKLNKASFKEKCNLIREAFTNLYSGLKNDEAALFHQELVSAYFETAAFVLLKRVQVLQNPDGSYAQGVTELDYEFCIKEVLSKLIELPVSDYVQNFKKLKSKAQYDRNIRITIPEKLAKLLTDLAERDFNPVLFTRICEVVQTALPNELFNSSRIISALLKQARLLKPAYAQIMLTTIFQLQISKTVIDLDSGIPEASKATIETIVNKIVGYTRNLQSLCKFGITSDELGQLGVDVQSIQLKAGSLMQLLQKKEVMANKMLKPEDLDKFQMIKKQLVNALVLQVNAGFKIAVPQLEFAISNCLYRVQPDAITVIAQADFAMEAVILDPAIAFPKKLDFIQYYQRLQANDALRQKIVETICTCMLSAQAIQRYNSLIDKTIKQTVSKQPSLLTSDDVTKIRQIVVQALRNQNQVATSTAYFESIQEFIIRHGSTNQDLRELLFDQFLRRDTPQSLWKIFASAIATKDQSSQEYESYCIQQLKLNLRRMIQNANRDLQSVEDFSHLTNLISQFTSLDKQRQVTLLQEIVLVPENFEHLEANPLPLKLFRDLFIEGSTWDVSKLISSKSGNQYTYVWLFATFLNFKHLISLSNYFQLKKQLVIFVETEVLPALIANAQQSDDEQNSFVVQLCAEMGRRAGIGSSKQPSAETILSYMHTLEFVVQKMSDPGDDFPPEFKPVLKIDEFKEIFQRVCFQTCERLLQSNFGIEHNASVDIAIKILKQTAYYLLDEQVVVELYKLAKANLTKLMLDQDCIIPPLFKQQTQVYIYLSKLLEAEGSEQGFKIDLVNILLQNIEKLSPGEISDCQDIVIELVDELLQSGQAKQLSEKIEKLDLHLTILDMLERTADSVQDTKPSDCSVQIKLCNVIKKTIGWTPTSSAIVSVYLQAVKDRAEWFDSKQKRMASGQVVQGLQQFEFEMLQEMAETLLVCIGFINEDVLRARAEENLFGLIGCQIQPLQKAAFVVLKYIYENFILPVEFETTEAQELQYLMDEAKKDDVVEESKDSHKKAKIAHAFKNVPKRLVDMIENAPNILAPHEDQSRLIADSSNLLEQLVFGKSQEGCMSSGVFGYFLAWNAVLIKIEQGRIKSQISAAQESSKHTDYMNVLAALTEYIEENSFIYEMLLVSLVGFFPPIKKGLNDSYTLELTQFAPEYCDAQTSSKQSRIFCLYSLINFMKSFPSLARKFYSECDRQLHEIVLPYIKQVVSPAIMEHEIKKIELSQAEMGANSDLTFVLFKSTKEIIATYAKGAEISVQIKLKIPAEYPLRSVQVDLGETLKLKQGQIRKWTLSIRNLIQQRNGDIISAVLLWKNNIDKEMDGVEECYICYCVMHGVDRSLPQMQCQNCKNKFHVACIRKWFSSSNKSNCPLCQTYFFQ